MPRKPTKDERRRAYFLARIDAAATPLHRMAAALDYLRTVVAHAPAEEAQRVAEDVVAYLLRIIRTVRTKERQ
ncbi:MAG: hypothetical protein ACRDN9_14350 [Streptosporangiaceae bacterium]